MSRACDMCGQMWGGFGATCSNCRRHTARRGSQLACATCGDFYHGYGLHCQDCQGTPSPPSTARSGAQSAREKVAAAHARREQRGLRTFDVEATVTQMVHQIARKIWQDGENTSDKHLLKTLFTKSDRDGSRTLDIYELDQAVRSAGFLLHQDQLQQMFETFDIDRNGGVKFWEFVRSFACAEDGTPQYRKEEAAAEEEERRRALERQRREAEEEQRRALERQRREAEEEQWRALERQRREAEEAGRLREAEESLRRAEQRVEQAARREQDAAAAAEAARLRAKEHAGVELGPDCTDGEILAAMRRQMSSEGMPLERAAALVDPGGSGSVTVQSLQSALDRLRLRVPRQRVQKLLSDHSPDGLPTMPTKQFVALLSGNAQQPSNARRRHAEELEERRRLILAQAQKCLMEESTMDRAELLARLAKEDAMVKQLREWLFSSVKKMHGMFAKMDRDVSKRIDFSEMQYGLQKAGVKATELESAILLCRYDRTGNGLLEENEFMRLLQNSKDISAHPTSARVWAPDGVYNESAGSLLFSQIDYRQAGVITVGELRSRLSDIGKSDDEIAALLTRLKAYVSDGTVSKQQFVKAYEKV